MKSSTNITILLIALSSPVYSMAIAYSGYVPQTLLYENGRFTGSHAPLVNCFHNQVASNKDPVIDTPPARQLQMLKSGGLDVSYVLTQTAERDQFAYASKPFYEIEAWILTHPDKEAARIRSVATVRNSYGIDEIIKMGAIYVNANSYAQALSMLEYGRVDAALVSGLAAPSLDAELLRKMKKQVLTKTALVVYVSHKARNAKDIVNRYSKAIATCLDRPDKGLKARTS
jgi:ABC-type amino acid transport substrate-binding protein